MRTCRAFASKRNIRLLGYVAGVLAASVPVAAQAAIVANPIAGCGGNTANFDPGNGQDIVIVPGYTLSPFSTGLNFPTGLAFFPKSNRTFEGFVLESGDGLPRRCHEPDSFGSGHVCPNNPL